MVEAILRGMTTCLVNILTLLWMKKLYGCKYRGKSKYVGAYIIFSTVGVIVGLLGNPVLNLLYSTVVLNLFSFLLFSGKQRTMFVYNLFYLILILAADVVSVYLWILIRGNTLQEVLSNTQYMVILYLINATVLLLLTFLFVLFFSKRRINDTRGWELLLQVLYYSFAMLVLSRYISKAQQAEDGIWVITIVMGFVVIDIVIIYILRAISELHEQQREYDIVKTQNELQLKHYQELSKKYEESRRIIHDVKKHLRIVQELGGEDTDKAKQYAKDFLSSIDRMQKEFICSNSILSVIMSTKMNEAEDAGVKVKVDAMDVDLGFMADVDITAIFANLWDNAIEANEAVPLDSRFIEVSLLENEGFLLLRFVNSYRNPVVEENGRMKTTKKKHEGLGVSIIRRTIERYGGSIQIHHEDGIFCVEIVIPVEKRSRKGGEHEE